MCGVSLFPGRKAPFLTEIKAQISQHRHRCVTCADELMLDAFWKKILVRPNSGKAILEQQA